MGSALRYLNFPRTLALGAVLVLAAQAGCVAPRNADSRPTKESPCPAWVDFPESYYDNENWVFFGCTNAFNLNIMLEKGSDVVEGRRLGPSSGVRESMAVERYNQGKINSATSTGSASPTIIMPAAGGSSP